MYVIYNKADTSIVEVRRQRPFRITSSYKSMAAAKAALTRMTKQYWEDSVAKDSYNLKKDPQFIYGIAEAEYYYSNIEKQVTRTGRTPGGNEEVTITMSINDVGTCVDPFTETYWSM